MGEIKTDMFPEVLRRKAEEKKEKGKKSRQGDTQSNAVIPAGVTGETLRHGKDRQGME